MASPIIITFIISLIPVFELRGAIPYGFFVAGLDIKTVFITALAANLLVAPALFFFLDYFHEHFMKIPAYRKLFGKFIERAKKKAEKHVNKYGYFGLALFVAIPLPVTGAYTGTLAAWFFGMQRKKAILSLSLGVIIASVIVTAVVLTGAGAAVFLNSHFLN